MGNTGCPDTAPSLRSVMLSVNPPYSRQIMSGKKLFEFRSLVLNGMDLGFLPEEILAYIYETKKKGGCGKVIGTVTISGIYAPLYREADNDPGIIRHRNKMIIQMYYLWCNKVGRKPNSNEGWFKDQKFMAYLREIGWTEDRLPNYVLLLEEPASFDVPMALSSFHYLNGGAIHHPPQNMCNCVLEACPQ